MTTSPSLVPWSTGTGGDTALVCIPWAGAGATPFRAWAPIFHHLTDLYGVRLAGRESRQNEPPATTLPEVVSQLTEELLALGTPRVAMFGQCSGALLAFEVAKALQLRGGEPQVIHLSVASQLPPRAYAGRPAESNQDLTSYIPSQLKEEPELIEVLLPILAADMELISHYAYTPSEILRTPLLVVYGSRDRELTRADIDGWRHETTGTTQIREIAGADHLFEDDAWLELARTIRAALE